MNIDSLLTRLMKMQDELNDARITLKNCEYRMSTLISEVGDYYVDNQASILEAKEKEEIRIRKEAISKLNAKEREILNV